MSPRVIIFQLLQDTGLSMMPCLCNVYLAADVGCCHVM